MLYRLIITKAKKNYYVGVSFSGTKYKVYNNEYIGSYKVGSDISFYAKKESGFFKDVLIPISDEEAGVKIINND
ncbi:hypothetical protein H7E67_10900 [Clostridium gasigenes]|nr:hypothetical protein [Clostridium gasigenes]MBB6623935.1 hypothetical protein [Clostridium gasigenes]MBB6716043.1 hypothetical protein [Clostridium gasigenes]MBU3131694.1 hypothetical protein [Clostridium gasigenes]NKF05455.1 hypothetical protein [Clostridium gasigenes]QSW18901.1 hypothetical protein J1C67_15345 [Clostridium gasigenes]